MNALIILTTIFIGVMVYVIGQLLSKLLIDPAYELRRSIGSVCFNLEFYAPTIHTPTSRTTDISDKATDALRENAAGLSSNLYAIPFYEKLSKMSRDLLPPRKSVEAAIRELRGLSTYMHEKGDKADNHIDIINDRVEKIKEHLLLKPIK